MAITKKQMIDGIRKLVGECEGDEKSVLDALLDESENWRMRMTEIEAEEAEEDEEGDGMTEVAYGG